MKSGRLLLACALLPGLLAAGEAWGLRPVPSAGVWGEVVADAYVARLSGAGRLEVVGKEGRIFSGELVERWIDRPALLPRAAVVLAADRRQAEVRRSYAWKGGQVEERLLFTCRSIAISQTFRAQPLPDPSHVTYFLQFPFVAGQPPPLAGGAYRFQSPGTVLAEVAWTESSPRLSLAALRGSHRQLELLSEGQAWFFAWSDARQGYLGLIDNNPRPPPPAGGSFHLGLLVWFSAPDGVNLPTTELRLVQP